MAFLRPAIIAGLTAFASFSAHASQIPPLLEAALEKGELANQIRWAYTSTFQNDYADLEFRFEPNGEDGAFTLLAPDALSERGEDVYARLRDDEDPDSDLTHEQVRIVIGDQDVQIVDQTDSYVVYAVRPNPWDDIDENQAGFFEHMMAELTVSRGTEQITQLRLYNHEPFRAQVVARVNRFEQVMEFAPEPITGLPLMISLRQEVEGSALFQRFHQVRQETYRDYNPVGLSAGEAPCNTSSCVQEFLAAQ